MLANWTQFQDSVVEYLTDEYLVDEDTARDWVSDAYTTHRDLFNEEAGAEEVADFIYLDKDSGDSVE
jgi:hypothetical protein